MTDSPIFIKSKKKNLPRANGLSYSSTVLYIGKMCPFTLALHVRVHAAKLKITVSSFTFALR